MEQNDEYQEAISIKPWLRFNKTDVLYLLSDVDKSTPMFISSFNPFDETSDYYVKWLNNQKNLEGMKISDAALTKKNP